MLNKAILMGRLTKDPELRYTSADNTAVCSFTLAIDRRYAKQGEEKQADFIPVVAWRNTAEFCGKYFTKGMQVVVVGRIQTRTYDDAQGVKRYVTEVVADEVHFADTKKASEGGAPRPAMPGTSGASGVPGAPGGPGSDGFFPTENDDELPF